MLIVRFGEIVAQNYVPGVAAPRPAAPGTYAAGAGIIWSNMLSPTNMLQEQNATAPGAFSYYTHCAFKYVPLWSILQLLQMIQLLQEPNLRAKSQRS